METKESFVDINEIAKHVIYDLYGRINFHYLYPHYLPLIQILSGCYYRHMEVEEPKINLKDVYDIFLALEALQLAFAADVVENISSDLDRLICIKIPHMLFTLTSMTFFFSFCDSHAIRKMIRSTKQATCCKMIEVGRNLEFMKTAIQLRLFQSKDRFQFNFALCFLKYLEGSNQSLSCNPIYFMNKESSIETIPEENLQVPQREANDVLSVEEQSCETRQLPENLPSPIPTSSQPATPPTTLSPPRFHAPTHTPSHSHAPTHTPPHSHAPPILALAPTNSPTLSHTHVPKSHVPKSHIPTPTMSYANITSSRNLVIRSQEFLKPNASVTGKKKRCKKDQVVPLQYSLLQKSKHNEVKKIPCVFFGVVSRIMFALFQVQKKAVLLKKQCIRRKWRVIICAIRCLLFYAKLQRQKLDRKSKKRHKKLQHAVLKELLLRFEIQTNETQKRDVSQEQKEAKKARRKEYKIRKQELKKQKVHRRKILWRAFRTVVATISIVRYFWHLHQLANERRESRLSLPNRIEMFRRKVAMRKLASSVIINRFVLFNKPRWYWKRRVAENDFFYWDFKFLHVLLLKAEKICTCFVREIGTAPQFFYDVHTARLQLLLRVYFEGSEYMTMAELLRHLLKVSQRMAQGQRVQEVKLLFQEANVLEKYKGCLEWFEFTKELYGQLHTCFKQIETRRLERYHFLYLYAPAMDPSDSESKNMQIYESCKSKYPKIKDIWKVIERYSDDAVKMWFDYPKYSFFDFCKKYEELAKMLLANRKKKEELSDMEKLLDKEKYTSQVTLNPKTKVLHIKIREKQSPENEER